jgi:hypothetical protein
MKSQSGPEKGHFQSSRPFNIPHQEVGSCQRERIHGSGNAYAVPLISPSTHILDGGKKSGFDDFDRHKKFKDSRIRRFKGKTKIKFQGTKGHLKIQSYFPS